jgi:preprotein translocase subunit SecA
MAILNLLTAPIRKVFGTRNDRFVKAFRRRVELVNAFEPQVRKLADEQLRNRAQEIRSQITSGKVKAADAMYEAFAVMRESLDRNVGIRNIFNPALKEQFPVAKLSPHLQELYKQVDSAMQLTLATQVQGSEVQVPGWMQLDIPNELHEAVREIYPESRPPFRCRPFDVQIIGGMVLSEGKIAEMKTGEGKTIVAPLACFMAVMEGLACHVVTVNDYLVQRDRDWVFPAFYRLGVTVGAIHPYHMQPEPLKKQMYQCDIVYGTNSEFGFDYLRDNMKTSVEEQVQRARAFCIVDEIDSILIDEARTPLIISGQHNTDAPQYLKANEVAEHLVMLQKAANQKTLAKIKEPGFTADAANRHRVPAAQIEKIVSKFKDLGPDYLDDKEGEMIAHTQYYTMKKEQKQAHMTPLGVEQAQKLVGTRFYVVGNDMGWDHLINNALRAHVVYEKDREYVVNEGEVVIVDEFTGRMMIGRQWSDGLHQAVEAKESRNGVRIKEETQTLATITIQNFFKLYKRLAGMTGTAITEATEFMEIYDLDVVVIPTNRPIVRQDSEDLIFLTEKAKWNAILEEVREKAEAGRPVLVGTTGVDKSEMLSRMLTQKHSIEHEVLNAKNHAREAAIVAKAGHKHVDKRGREMGNVTIATNMAGRGTDIKLLHEVVGAGGLHIVGTERHEARRIDNQLRGRAGRQGDPGSSRFFIAMEDDLMKMFAGATTMKALTVLGMKEDEAIEHRWITKSVERAQRKVEERNYEIRKSLLEYDEVMEHQRNGFYGTRQKVLEGTAIKELIFEYIAEAIEDAVGRYMDASFVPTQVAEGVKSLFGVQIDAGKLRGHGVDDIENRIRSDARNDARQDIGVSVGEYMNDEIDPAEWDLAGLQQWAHTRYGVELRPSRLRDMNSQQVVDHLTEVAQQNIDSKPLDSLARYFEKDYALRELSEWAKNKFDLDVTVAELSAGGATGADAQQKAAELIFKKAEEAYERREIEYPSQFVLETAFGAAAQGAEATAWAVDQLARWANHRFDMKWTPADVVKHNGQQLHEVFFEASHQWHGPKLDAWVRDTLSGHPTDEMLIQRFGERWGVRLSDKDLAEADRAKMVRDRALLVLRSELTQLERTVLLQILDQTWKDHLYAMDQLKDSIGLQAYAEKDPKIMYKAEGSRMFQEMLKLVRDKVTDLIFRARLTANVRVRNPYQNQQAEHQVIENTGVTAAAALEAAEPAQASDEQKADLESARRAGSAERAIVQQIKRHDAKVGRNDPCPCGSGKKYKQCCGKVA